MSRSSTPSAPPPAGATVVPDWSDWEYLLVGWPERGDTWREGGGPAQAALVAFIEAVLGNSRGVSVVVAVGAGAASASGARARLVGARARHGARVRVWAVPMDDAWVRDTGPVVLADGGGACFRFNAWGGAGGGCYAEFGRDAGVGRAVCARFGLRAREVGFVLEGGAVVSDGEGTVIATRESVLNENRNGAVGEREVEGVLREALGAAVVIWVGLGAAFDRDTDGHADNLVMFTRAGRVVLLWAEEAECREQHRRSRLAWETLRRSTDARGRRLEVVKVPMGGVVRRGESEAARVRGAGAGFAQARPAGEAVCASYVNFVVVEGVVFAPSFGDERADERARQALLDGFEGRCRVVMTPAREFVLAGGGLHCLTLGLPKGVAWATGRDDGTGWE